MVNCIALQAKTPDIKLFSDGLLITWAGSEFQSLTTLWLKIDCLIPNLACFYTSFWLCPQVADPKLISKNILLSALSIPFMILYVFIISPLLQWCCIDGNLRALSHLSHGRCFSSGISLVAYLWMFSISTLSCLNLGCQIIFPYSKCG